MAVKTLFSTVVALSFWFYLQVGAARIPNVVDTFLRDISNNSVSNRKIIYKHFCISSDMRRANAMGELIERQLDELRGIVLTKNVGNKMTIKLYSELPDEEKVLLTDKRNENNIYKVSVSKAHFFLLIEKEKILAFATLNKGGKRVFQRICNR